MDYNETLLIMSIFSPERGVMRRTVLPVILTLTGVGRSWSPAVTAPVITTWSADGALTSSDQRSGAGHSS